MGIRSDQNRDDERAEKPSNRAKRAWWDFSLLEYVVVVAIITLLGGVMMPTCSLPPRTHWLELILPLVLLSSSVPCGLLCLATKRWAGVWIFVGIGLIGGFMLVNFKAKESAWLARRTFWMESRMGVDWIRHEGLIPRSPWDPERSWDEDRFEAITEGTPMKLSERTRPDRNKLPNDVPEGWRRIDDFVVYIETATEERVHEIVVGYSVAHKNGGARWILFSDGKDKLTKPTQADVDQWNADRAALGLSPIPGLP